jgi:hypothetical protein
MTRDTSLSSKGAHEDPISPILRKVEELDALNADLELFTRSGSWIYDEDLRTIQFSAGGYRVLGVVEMNDPMPLTLLECMCAEGDRQQLLDLLALSHFADTEKSVQFPIHDSYGNQISVVMCTRNSADKAGNIKRGLIKFVS